MSSLLRPIATSAFFTRSAAIAALMGATMLASPLTAAHANSASNAPTPLLTHSALRHQVAENKAETVEQRITNLHAALQITPDEEPNWNSVAQTMRDSAAKMEKLSAEKTDTAPSSMTALDDLKTYERFAHAHFDGLKDLVSSFETLYTAMPDAQKRVADHVFQTYGGRERVAPHA